MIGVGLTRLNCSITGLKCSSALFRHEIAYVLGQIQHPAAVKQLAVNLRVSMYFPYAQVHMGLFWIPQMFSQLDF